MDVKIISNNPKGQLTYTLESPDWANVELKKQQYKLSENEKSLKISLELINAKIKNQ